MIQIAFMIMCVVALCGKLSVKVLAISGLVYITLEVVWAIIKKIRENGDI